MEIDNLYEYLGIIAPNQGVSSAITMMKIRCKSEHRLDSATRSEPHFTVFKFLQPLQNEARLTNCLTRNIVNISPFTISLSGFDYFPGPSYTLYVKLKNEKEFKEMAQYIRAFSKLILKRIKKNPAPHYSDKGHLTIAKGISADEFMKIWPTWQHATYEADTNATSILLLRRLFSKTPLKYELIGEYHFLGEGIPELQLKLF